MKKLWKLFFSLIIICLIIGVALTAASFLTGGSIEALRAHGDIPRFFDQFKSYADAFIEGAISTIQELITLS